MRRHLLVVSEKKIKLLKIVFEHNLYTHITNICIQYGLIIVNTVGVMLRTDDAGHRTMDAGPSTPYYKLTGELKKAGFGVITL